MIVDTELKYRPNSLSEFVFPDEHVEEIIWAYVSGEITRSLILAGPYGTGKTLLTNLLPDAIEGKKAEVNKVPGTVLNSAADVKKHFCINKGFYNAFTINGQRFNYHIVEELNVAPANNASNKKQAIDALKIALEEYRGTDLTIFTTNELKNIDPGLRSRCHVVKVPPCKPDVFFARAKQIMVAEGAEIEDAILLSALEDVYTEHYDNRAYYKALEELLRAM